MVPLPKALFHKRIMFSILIPVILVGIFCGVLFLRYAVSPMTATIHERTERLLSHAADMALALCEERFNDILDLRLEDDLETNLAIQREAVKQVVSIHKDFKNIHILVIENESEIRGSSLKDLPSSRKLPRLPRLSHSGEPMELLDMKVVAHTRYFPFWRWHIVAFLSHEDYLGAIRQVRLLITAGMVAALGTVILAVVVLFAWRVHRPLRRLIEAADQVAEGNLETMTIGRSDEIGRVSGAFNAMVHSLAEDKRKIRQILSDLRDSEEKYRILSENSLALVMLIRKEHCLYANRRALDVLGYREEAFIGMALPEILHPEDRARVSKELKSIEDGRMGSKSMEYRMVTQNGQTVWFESLATLILHKDHHAILSHSVDISKRKKEQAERTALEERLVEAQKMEAIGSLAGGVAHDLNNILGGIVGYPELLLMELSEDSPMYQPLQAIQHSGQRAADIVQDMLTLARRSVSDYKVVDLSQLLKGFQNSPDCGTISEAHPGVQFHFHSAGYALPVMGSEANLRKAVLHLLQNGAEALPSGGQVTISSKLKNLETAISGFEAIPAGQYAVIGVHDTGVGISEVDKRKIFEPFYTKKVMGRGGSGLGMAVTWGTIKDHDGFVDITTNSLEGTLIELYFPCTCELPATDVALPLANQLRGTESILVVDDVVEQRQVASRMLSGLGYQVVVAASGEEGLAEIKKKPFDLVVLDMIMDPGIDGLETYRQMVAIRPGQRAIIVSGYSENERVREAQRLGAGNYVRKPYVIKALAGAVRSELDRS